jgi:translocation and assembly module TamB
MDRSSLAFLTGQVPGIESIAGEVSLDATVSGKIGAPQIKGNSQLGLQRLRLENRLAPSLQDIVLVANFAENRLVLEKLSALVAGGTLEGNGEVLLKPGGEPTIQLRLTGSEVLVVRTPDVNVRTDLDLTLAGPVSKAALTGEVGITNSRYFKNFDLLPIGLPAKKTTSVLPTVDRAPAGGGTAYQDLDVGVKIAPFQDWTVAVRMHTKDPFLIRSNLLESSISADLNLTGTLGRPIPIGAVEIQKGEMSLPFSKVDVETGRIVFDAATGFNGALEFKARGKADRYQISIFLYDRVLSPQYVLTSIPPLPSEDIMTLLATGTTRDELTGGDPGSMAAGKAAGLLFKNLQKKSNEVEGDPTLLDLLEDRTELELGRVNQETGEQTFGGKIRLWKQLFFVGDVDAQSDYRALLKYVFRFE